MYFTIYRDSSGQYRWTLYAENNRKIADSAEGYLNKAGAQHGADLVRSTNAFTPIQDQT
jgi:uncharacterized protein YegP (UPF0339 family)